jgi:hypothetical protein
VLIVPGFDAPDHGYDEHQARATLDGLIGLDRLL